jgi:hypothetical protein
MLIHYNNKYELKINRDLCKNYTNNLIIYVPINN